MTVRYVPKRRGILAVMQSPEMEQVVLDHAEQIAARARSLDGQNYGSRSKIGRISAHGYAYTSGWYAMKSNAENDTLSKALGGGVG